MNFLNLIGRAQRKLQNLILLDRRRLYAVSEAEHLRRLLAHCQVDCVFDVGANNGQYAKMLRTKAGYRGRIVSFEPNPVAAVLARKAAEGDSLWTVEECALSSADGTQAFNVMRESEFSSLSQPRRAEDVVLFADKNVVERSVIVRTETVTSAYLRLEAQYGFARPFLKLDTQGFDVQIVANAGPSLEHFVGLQSELAIRKLYDQSVDFREAISVYESAGFELSAFVPNNAGHFPHLMEIDCVMIRRALLN